MGQSIDLARRWRGHFSELRNGIHGNIHLQASYNKYGKDSFIFIILERTDDLSKLTELEDKWVSSLRSNDKKFGYNKRICVDSSKGISGTYGIELANAKRKKIWESKSPEEKVRINSLRGAKAKKMWEMASEEQKEKMLSNLRISKKGKPSHIKGQKLSDEHRAKLVEAWVRRKARGDKPGHKSK